MTDVQKDTIAEARKAIDELRDFSRRFGMHFRQRDPLVVAIHKAIDLAETSDQQLTALRARVQQTVEEMRAITATDLRKPLDKWASALADALTTDPRAQSAQEPPDGPPR